MVWSLVVGLESRVGPLQASLTNQTCFRLSSVILLLLLPAALFLLGFGLPDLVIESIPRYPWSHLLP